MKASYNLEKRLWNWRRDRDPDLITSVHNLVEVPNQACDCSSTLHNATVSGVAVPVGEKKAQRQDMREERATPSPS